MPKRRGRLDVKISGQFKPHRVVGFRGVPVHCRKEGGCEQRTPDFETTRGTYEKNGEEGDGSVRNSNVVSDSVGGLASSND